MRPKVSIVIPAYQAEKYLRATLESVKAQTYSDFEVIIVNDGSRDGTGNLADEFASKDLRFRHIFQKNQGVSAARNTGYGHSNGEYLAFLDADDIWLPDNLESKVAELDSTPSTGLVHSDCENIDSNGIPTGEFMSGKSGKLLTGLLLRTETQIPGPSSILLRRTVMEATGLFDQNVSTSADYDFFVRVSSRFEIGRIPRVTWYYRKHPGNMHMNVGLMEHDMLRIMNKFTQVGIFPNQRLQKASMVNLYRMLGASWWGDGNNKSRGVLFLGKSILISPSSITIIVQKGLRKLIRK